MNDINWQYWKEETYKVGKIFLAGGMGALLAWLGNLPAEPTVIFVIAGLRLIEGVLKS